MCRKSSYRICQHRRHKCVSCITVTVIVLGLILAVLNLYQLQCMKAENKLHELKKLSGKEAAANTHLVTKRPVVWIHGTIRSKNNGRTGYLKHVFLVFEKFGFSFGEKSSDWIVAWFHDFPFTNYAEVMKNLKPYQKVNHLPGSGYLTNKVNLAQTNLNFIPRAFEIPAKKKQFVEYASKHRNTTWVQKSNQHRGILLKSIDNIDLSVQGTFVQEYIAKPFLIDGRKFDIGVYTVITSVDPLTVYYIDGDALFRFCPEEYYPFHASNTNKYVVGDDYLPLWQVPSLKDLYEEKGFSFKNTFNEYLSSIGKDHTSVWDKMKSAIRDIILKKEIYLIASLRKYSSKWNFFELVRFDFVIDENLNVFLIECNMSPNLSSDHFSKNAVLYEHVLLNTLSLVGVLYQTFTSNKTTVAYEENMLVSPQDITVFPDYCKGNFCSENCQTLICQLCEPCLQADLLVDLKRTFLEHVQRGSSRRIVPPSVSQKDALEWSPGIDLPVSKYLNTKNRLIYLWFVGKCRQDAGWCH
ncbi:unnamed protein product [Candidula unifasciata]|uniref:Uncharacterized protein n=1 Tax=Candidula unifasciata TaxID=100452 RepID=A0A8S3ZNK8_9EUPU|nr:unnamed protein product [Candidula unifasciata]